MLFGGLPSVFSPDGELWVKRESHESRGGLPQQYRDLRSIGRGAVAVFGMVLSVVAGMFAQEPTRRPLTVDDLLGLEQLRADESVFSVDASRMAYVRVRALARGDDGWRDQIGRGSVERGRGHVSIELSITRIRGGTCPRTAGPLVSSS